MAPKQAGGGGVAVEEVARDLAGMSAEEQRAAVTADAPELAALLADLQGCLAEVRGRVGPLLQEVRPATYSFINTLMFLVLYV